MSTDETLYKKGFLAMFDRDYSIGDRELLAIIKVKASSKTDIEVMQDTLDQHKNLCKLFGWKDVQRVCQLPREIYNGEEHIVFEIRGIK